MAPLIPTIPDYTARYTLDGAAFLLKTSRSTVSGWANGYSKVDVNGNRIKTQPVLSERDDSTLLSYWELIELLFVRELVRKRRDPGTGVELPPITDIKTVRKVINNLKPILGDYPLASAGLKTIGAQLVSEKVEDDLFTNVETMQHLLGFAEELSPRFVYEDGLVMTWYPTGDHSIKVDPRIKFGQPVTKSGLTSHVIYKRFLLEDGDYDCTSDWFDIEESEVRDAIRFEEAWALRNAA